MIKILIIKLDYKKYVKVNKLFFRPTEVDTLISNSLKAQKILNWKPKFTFDQLVRDMVNSDLKFVKDQKY